MTLKAAYSEFLTHCVVEKNLSQKTQCAYRTDLLQFENFLRVNHDLSDITAITKSELRKYLESISFLKPKSIKRKVATLKALFNFLEFEEKIASNPFRKMRINIRDEKRLPRVMDITEISSLLRKAYHQKKNREGDTFFRQFESVRDALVLELLFSTGARVSEISNLKAENINWENGTVIIKGKGRKERLVHICGVEPFCYSRFLCDLGDVNKMKELNRKLPRFEGEAG